MKLAVYSGSFDPIHKGHLSVAKKALNIVDEFVFMVEPKPLNKQPIASLKQRQSMISLAINNPKFSLVTNYKNQPHTTISINNSLENAGYKNYQLYWLMGSDVFKFVSSWQDFENCKNYQFIVATRGVNNQKEVEQQARILELNIEIIKINNNSSSKEFRQTKDFSLVGNKVANYIKTNKLY